MTSSFQNKKYGNKAQISEDLVKRNSGLSIAEFVDEQCWNEDTELITHLIKDNLTENEFAYLEEKLGDLGHLKDNRSCEEYALDLVTGWLIEDIFVYILSNKHDVERQSADKEREFLGSPNADSDLAITINDKETPLEVTHDNSGFWQREEVWSTLRDSKFENLKDENALILGLDMKNKEIFLLWAQKADKIGKEYNQRINKQASKINLENVKFYDINKLEKVLENKIMN